jgi:hypothetical protein
MGNLLHIGLVTGLLFALNARDFLYFYVKSEEPLNILKPTAYFILSLELSVFVKFFKIYLVAQSLKCFLSRYNYKVQGDE